MKRKSILFCLTLALGMLFAGTAFAQLPTQPTKKPAGFRGADTLYVCKGQDAAIELGVDVCDALVFNSHGKWSALYNPSGATSIGAYVDGSNVWNVSNAAPGMYLFQYVVTDSVNLLCDLHKGDSIWAYIAIIPDSVAKGNHAECFDAVAGTKIYTQAELLALAQIKSEWAALIAANATLTFEKTVPAVPSVDLSVVGNTDIDAIWAVKFPGNKVYCSETFTLRLKVRVDSVHNVTGDTLTLCNDQLNKSDENIYDYFGVQTGLTNAVWAVAPGATGAPAASLVGGNTIKFSELKGNVGDLNDFTFTWVDTCGKTTTKTVTFRIRIVDTTKKDYGTERLAADCKDPNPANNRIHLNSELPAGSGSADWMYFGNTATGGGMAESPLLNSDNVTYAAKGAWVNSTDVLADVDKMYTNTDYYFKYKISEAAASCDAGKYGVIIISFKNSGGDNRDYRIQICVGDNAPVDFNEQFNLAGAIWTVSTATSPALIGSIMAAPQPVGTHIYDYARPSTEGINCIGDNGKAYVKVTDNFNITDATLYICIQTKPASINLWDVIGAAQMPGTWDAVSTAMPEFTSSTGILDIRNLPAGDYAFKFAATSDCFTGDINVTLKIGTTLNP